MRFFTNKLFLFFLLVCSLSGYAQTVNYTAGPMDVDVFISNRCSGTNNGSLIFTVNSTSVAVGGSVSIQIFGPVNLVVPQTVLVGNTFTFNAAQTLPAGTYNLIIVDNDDNSLIINTFGGDPPAVISDLPTITLTDGAGTNLVNSDCTNPDGGIEVSLSGGSQVLAGGGSYTYTFSATNGLAGLPLTGTFDGTTSLNLATLLGLGGLPGGDYTLLIDDDYSRCGATSNWTITDPQPSLQSITNAGGQTICTGQNATVNLGGSELGVLYEVLVNGVATGVTQVGTGAAISFSVPSALFATGQVLSVIARLGSCSPRIMTGAITMTVRPLPTASVSGGGSVCAGAPLPNVTFTFTGTAPFTFTYTDGVTPVTINNHPTTTFTLTNAPAGTYSVTALTDANTCVGTSLGTPVSVIVNPLPTATISGGGPVCAGSPLPNVTFTFTGTAPFTFTYTDGVTPVTINNHPSTTFTITNAPAGTYSVTALTDANTCVGTSLGTPVSVVVNALPTAATSGGGTVCAGSPLPNVTFTFTGTAPFTFTYTDGVTPVTINNHPTTTFTLTNAPAGSYSVTALTDANACVATSLGGTVSVIVNPLPTATISGGGPVCAGSPLPNVTFTFTGTTPFTFTYTDGVTPVTVNNHPSTTFTITNAPAGTYSVTALTDANTCVGTSLGTPVSVVVNALPTAVTSGGGTVCTGSPLPGVTFTFTGTAPFTFTYTDGVTPVTVNNHATTTFTLPNAPAGTYSVTALTDANACAATSLGGTVSVIVNPLPTITITTFGPVCEGATTASLTYSLTTGLPDQYSIDFNAAAEAQGFTDVVAAALTASPLSVVVPGTALAGTYDATLTVINSGTGCASTPQNISITINSAADAGLDGADSACTSDTSFDLFASLGGTPDAGGTWTDVDGSGAIISGNLVNLNGVAGGTYPFAYTVTGTGTCPDATATVTLTIDEAPDAGGDNSVTACNTDAAFNILINLSGTPQGGGTWVDLDGSGAVITGNFIDLTTLAVGTYHYQYTVTGTGSCLDDVSVLTILVIDTAPDAGSDNTVPACNTDAAFNLFTNLGGSPDPGGTWTDMDASGALITGDLLDLTTLAAGTYRYQYNLAVAGCGGASAIVTVNVTEGDDPGLDNSASACNSDTAFDLFASLGGTPDPGGTWVDVDGSGAVITGNTVNLNFVPGGTYPFAYTIAGTGPCANATATVSLTIVEAPDAGTDNTVTACNTDAAFNILINLGGAPQGGGTWVDLDGSGAVITGNFIDLTTLAVGTYRYQYTVTGTAPCVDAVSVLTINVINSTPDAGSDNTVSACSSETAFNLFTSLGGTPDPGGTWTDLDASGALITGNAADFTTVLVAGLYRYRYDLAVAGCGGASAIVTVDITIGVDAGLDNAATACNSDAAFNLFSNLGGTPDAGGTWTDVDGSGGVIAGDIINLTTVLPGVYTFDYTVIGTAPCVDAVATVTVTVTGVPNAGIDNTVTACNSDLAFDLFASLGGTPDAGGAWIDVNGSGGTITGNTIDLTGVAAASGPYNFDYVITGTAPCINDTARVTVNVIEAPDAGADSSVAACNSDTSFNLFSSLGGTPDAGGTWTDVDGSGGVIAGNIIDLTGVVAGTYTFDYTVTGTAPCVDAVATVTLTVTNGPSIAVAGVDQVICGGVFTTNLGANAPTSGVGTWVIASGPGGFVVTPNSPTSLFIGSVGNSYLIRWIITSGSCAPSIDTVAVNFAASPAVTSPVTVCVNTAAPTLNAAAAGATSFNWYLGTGPSRVLLTTTAAGNFTPGAELNLTTPGSVTYEVTAVYGCGESPGSQIVVNVSNTGGCGGGTGNCATVVITPNPSPATCTLSTGSVTFTINPFVPLINNEGVIIKIDGISSTNLSITRTQYNDTSFVNLPMGTYSYSIVYGDSSCIKPGTFTIDQSGTIGTPVASNIVRPVCAGSATGSATIDVPGETGNLLEYSFDAIVWTPFVSGAPGGVTGIMAGPGPTFERLISVRRNSTDPCNAAVSIVIQDINAAITATFQITPATCNGNDGAITNIVASGGSGSGFQFSLDGINFQTANSFTNRSGGLDTLIVRDGVGCIQGIPFSITFPGFVQYTVTKQDADCTNNGVSGSITVDIVDIGTFMIAVSTDGINAPADEDYINYLEPSMTFPDLAKGQYFVYVKSVAAACPSFQPVTILGVQTVSFDIEYGCLPGTAPNIDKPYLKLINIVANPLFPIEVHLTKGGIYQGPIYIGTVVGTGILFEYDVNVFLQTPGDDYEVEIRQTDFGVGCEVTSTQPFVVPRRLSASIGTLTESYPDIQTGSMQVMNFDGGINPYEIRIELDSASSFDLPVFETSYEEVGLNSNLQFEKVYKNIPAGRYLVQVQDSLGCFIERIARVPLDTDIFIPNVFTPNDDGRNDEFFIRNLPVPGAKLIVTNRWGKEVYSSTDYQNNWKGDGVADGIYFYRLQGAGADALTGWVEIIRGQKP